MILSDKKVKELTARYHRYWEASFYDAICDSENKSLFGIRIEFRADEETSRYETDNKLIVIGLLGTAARYKIESTELLVSVVEFLRTHEIGHVRFTADEPYAWGAQRGMEIIIEYIAKAEGLHMRFRKEADYDYAISELARKGVIVNKDALHGLTWRILNSLCDGRIERILANEYANFDTLCSYFNYKDWEYSVCTLKKSTLNAVERMILYLNNILFLSIVQIYQKGFLTEFAGTEEENFIKSLMPYIYKGITARSTREMVDNAGIPIITALAPVIYEAVKEYKQTAIKQIIEGMIKLALESGFVGVSEDDAEENDSEYHPMLPMNDLEVTLEDDKYDELVKKLKNKGKSENGLKIKRKHPLPKNDEEDESNENDSSKLESGSGRKAEKEESDEQSGGSGSNQGEERSEQEKGSEKMSGAASGSDDAMNSGSQPGASMENSSDGSEGDSGEQMKGDSKTDKSGGEKPGEPGSENKPSGSNPTGKNESDGSQKGKTSVDELNRGADDASVMERITREMEEAAKKLNADAKNSIDSVNASIRSEASSNRFKPVKTDTAPLTQGDVKDVCKTRFKEVKRRFELTDQLPVDLESRGKTLNRHYLEFMRNRRKPVSRMRTEGAIDSRNIWRLGVNKIDVFMKEGKTEDFDGCAYFLLDNSGSMYGNKKMAACRALAVQELAFYGLYPFKIVAFDECGCVFHEVLKDWDERQPYSTAWNFALHGRDGSGNADEHDIRIATMELLKRSERRKLLIVLSDGAPDDVEDTKRAIAEARKKGITVVGIYFEEGDIDMKYCEFPYMYEKDYVLCNTMEIEKNLSAILEKFFKS